MPEGRSKKHYKLINTVLNSDTVQDILEVTGVAVSDTRNAMDTITWGKTAAGLYVPITVNNQGEQLVQLSSGVIEVEAVTIANGASITSEIDLDGKHLVGISFPSTWATANLTFQAAPSSGGTYRDVWRYGSELTEYEPSTGFDSRYFGLSEDVIYGLLGARYIKIRSGTAAAAVTQGANCTLTLHLAAL